MEGCPRRVWQDLVWPDEPVPRAARQAPSPAAWGAVPGGLSETPAFWDLQAWSWFCPAA